MAKYYRIDSTVPAYANRFGLTGRDKYVYANSPSEARRTALALIGPNLPAAALLVEEVPVITGSTAIEKGTGELLNYQPTGQQVTSVDPTGYIPSAVEEGLGESGISLGLNPGNIEGFYRGGGATGNLPGGPNLPGLTGSDVPGFNLPYRGTGQAAGGGFTDFTNGLTNASFNDLINMPSVAAPTPPVVPVPQDFGMADELFAIDPSTAGGSGSYSIGANPYTYGETFVPPVKDTVVPRDIFDVSSGATGAIPQVDFDKQEEERREREIREQKTAKEAKEAALLTGAVRSWDAKLADITLSYDEKGNVSVNLPVDMWRNADDRPGNIADQIIGKEQIEDAIRRLAELGGRDILNRTVEQMLQKARRYYADTPRGDGTWDRNIDGGLIPEDQRKAGTGTSFLNDSAWKATWGSFADEVLGKKAGDIDASIPFGWTNNVAGWNQLAPEQQAVAKANNLNSMQELENYYDQINLNAMDDLLNIDAMGGTSPPGGASDGTGSTDPVVVIDPMQELLGIDPMGSASPESGGGTGTGTGTGTGAGTGGDPGMASFEASGPIGDAKQFDFANFGGMFQGPAPAPAAGTVGVPAWSSQDLINDPQGFLTAAGQRLAFRNVFGEPATGVGPLASYLQRQTYPLTQAYRAAGFANIAREQAGEVAPQTTFENFLASVRDQPTGLGGAYGQALQNVNYLRGLGGSQVPTALAGVFNPEQAAATRDARNLLEAAQRGKYSGLVSRSFRRPTEEDLFSDYVLARQDAATAGTAPQNFLNFAASRYGL